MATIISGSNSKEIAYDLSIQLQTNYCESIISRFADQEAAPIYGEKVIIVQSTYKPANDHLMELLLLIDAAKRQLPSQIIVLIPYLGYSRQDRPSYAGGPISARLISTLLEAAGASRIITIDLHTTQIEGFYNIGVQNIDPLVSLTSALKTTDNPIVVSPDIGGILRAEKLAKILNCDLAIVHKTRSSPNTSQAECLIGQVENMDCILVDDLIDTGGTLCNAAVLLKKSGAKSIQALITHAIISNNAIDTIHRAPIDNIITTNSIPHLVLTDKFRVVDMTPMLCEALHHP